MKKIISLLVTVLFLLHPGYCAFETFNLGVKPMALADTFCSSGDEPVGMIYNPAQTVQIAYPSLSTTFSRPNLGWGEAEVSIYSLYYAYPLKDSNKGPSPTLMTFGFGVSYLGSNINYSEFEGLLNLSRKYRNIFESDINMALGVNAKLLQMGRGDPSKPWDPALKETKISRLTADVGAWFEYNNIVAGLSSANIAPADFGVVVQSLLPNENRIGVTIKDVRIGDIPFKFTPSAEFTTRNSLDTLSGGLNIYLLSGLDMQLGVSQDNLGFGMTVFTKRPSEQDPNEITSSMRIDVSWLFPISGMSTAGSPQVGMLLFF